MGENASSSSSGYEFGSSDPILLGISSYVGGAELSQQGLYNVPLASMVPFPQPKGPDNPVKPAPAIQRNSNEGTTDRDNGSRIRGVEQSAAFVDEYYASPPSSSGGGELQKLHHLMHGRYFLTLALAIVLGGVGTWAGFKSGDKYYQSVGQLHVLSEVPKILYTVEDNATLNDADPFVDEQIAILQSQRVMEAAMDDKRWVALGRGNSTDIQSQYRFAQELSISFDKGFITVKVTDPDPAVAQTGVQCLMDAYDGDNGIYKQEVQESESERSSTLNRYRTDWTDHLNSVRKNMNAAAYPYAPDSLSTIYQARLAEYTRLESAKAETEQALKLAADPNPSTRKSDTQLGDNELAALDKSGGFQQLLMTKAAAERAVERLQRAGILENNQAMKEAIVNQDFATQDVAEYRKQLTTLLTEQNYDSSSPDAFTNQSLGPLKKQLDSEQKQFDVASASLTQIEDQISKVEELRDDETETQHRLDQVEERIEELQVEDENSNGRVVKSSDATLPIIPFKDTRWTFAGVGGTMGSGLALAIMLGIGLVDHRVRSASETESRVNRKPVLGLLPVLPEEVPDPEKSALTAHCLQEIRMLLQLYGRGQDQRVFAITSPAGGTGKTSLSLALGLSFASARQKTLVIDFDLVGGGLTNRIEKMEQITSGLILMEKGLVTQEQIDDARSRINGSHRSLEDVLVELGHLSKGDAQSTLFQRHGNNLGTMDALNDEPLDKCVAPTAVDKLFVLSIGRATAADVATITPDLLGGLLAKAKRHFDTILVDTGPIPGSVEASIAAVEADAVILTISHGESKHLVEKSVRQLDRIGARLAGVVFNRAAKKDILAYGSSRASSSSSRYTRPSENRLAEVKTFEVPGAEELGPIASAVASYAPLSRNVLDRAS